MMAFSAIFGRFGPFFTYLCDPDGHNDSSWQFLHVLSESAGPQPLTAVGFGSASAASRADEAVDAEASVALSHGLGFRV